MFSYLLKRFGLVILIVAIFSITAIGGVTKNDLVIPKSGKIQIITLDDGSSLVGRITDIGDDEIKFQSDLGEITIAISKIVQIKEVDDTSFREGKYWFPNPNRTRLYIAPTGRMLNKGEGYFYDTWIFFPGAAYAITDNVTIGAGITIFPGVDFNKQLLILTPKVGLNSDGPVDLAISGMFIKIPVDDPVTVGLINVVGTVGSDDNSLTVGLGYGYAEGKLGDKPAVILGGELRFARRMSFVSENWIIPGVNDALISYGIRFLGEKVSADFAFFNILDEDAVFPGTPYLGLVWNF
ncbi:MAG: hypothetical protein DRP51_01145 [Candidatus Zixiibacteriota bacterium]|nr:MAG: hypothetical protein DRP51_01145 [candidate division Zixibacteria bacterium]